MKATTPDEKPKQSEANTPTLTAGQRFWKRLDEKGYSNDMVDQAFVMSWKPPKNEKKTSSE